MAVSTATFIYVVLFCKIIVMEISNWFKGFEKGIARLSPEERSAFFSECGKNCVNGGTLSVYKKLYEDAKGNMDVFFQMANDLPEVKAEVVEKGHVYRLIFLKCTCELYKRDMSLRLCSVNVHAKV